GRGARRLSRLDASLLLRGERAAHDAFASALRQLDPFACVAVLALALALAGMRGARAVVLAGLGDAVALFRVVVLRVVGREGLVARERDETDGRREDCCFRVHQTHLLKVVWGARVAD